MVSRAERQHFVRPGRSGRHEEQQEDTTGNQELSCKDGSAAKPRQCKTVFTRSALHVRTTVVRECLVNGAAAGDLIPVAKQYGVTGRFQREKPTGERKKNMKFWVELVSMADKQPMECPALSAPDINFRNIRKHRSSQNDGFEELTRQLVLADPPEGHTSIENRGPGADGGVEILVRFADDRVWGWQSKFFPDAFGSSEVSQLKKSFSAALKNFPSLERYYVAVPRNFSGRAEGDQDTQTKNWIGFKTWCSDEAAKTSMKVEILLWDESYFVSKLQSNQALYAGMRLYWFDDKVFTDEWFADQLEKSLSYIGRRYRPDDHVNVKISDTISVLRRDDFFSHRYQGVQDSLLKALGHLRTLLRMGSADNLKSYCLTLIDTLEALSASISRIDSSALCVPELADILTQLKKSRHDEVAYNTLNDALYERTEEVDSKTGKTTTKPLYSYEVRDEITKFSTLITEVAGAFSHIEIEVFRQPVLLVGGEAGIGKSHLLANEASHHLASGGAALFIPARVLDKGDRPEQEILSYLDIADLRFETFLAALHSAALTNGKPALVLIDGLNESMFAKGWEAGLPSLITQFKRFERIAFVSSIRSSYRELCIRKGLNIPEITHHGFRGHLGEAAKEYLDRNGIERPSAPIFGLNEILYNPLFLSTAVDYMKSKGLTSFPRGLDSISPLITFWLGAVETNILAKGFERISSGDGKILHIMQRIASEMATSGSEFLDYKIAHNICEEVVDLAPPTKDSERILSKLIDEGLLIDVPSPESETGKQITFGFQKFGDYFISDAILRDTKSTDILAASLRKGGKYEYLFSDERLYEFVGPRVALLALTPSRLGVELPLVDDDFISEVGVRVDDFLQSVLWRQADGISPETVRLLEGLREPSTEGRVRLDDRQWFDLLLQLAPITDCLINASYLKRILANLPLGERDASWSTYLVGRYNDYEDDDWPAIQQLIDWAWVAPKSDVEIEKVQQVGITLALLTSTMDRNLRDCATKALASLQMKFPPLIPLVINEFSDWDDPYVRERVLAASASAILYCSAPEILEQSAQAADKMAFQRNPVERHAWTRRYAQIIVEYAANNLSSFDSDLIARATPPYASAPITAWPTLDEIAPQQEKASSIFRSVVGFINTPFDGKPPMMAGDFGRYTMGSIDNYFSQVTRGNSPPLTRKQEVEDFWNAVAQLGEDVENARLELTILSSRDPRNSYADLLKTLETSEPNSDKSDEPVSDSQELSDAYEELLASIEIVASASEVDKKPLDADKDERNDLLTKAESDFLSLLPQGLKDDYQRLRPLDRYGEQGVPKFNLLKGQCWVFNRALELGWQNEVHEAIERNVLRYTHDRHGHEVERIGKKYQHIAFGELVGYLADYHWYVDWNDEPSILHALEEFERADIDASYLSGTYSRPAQTFMPNEIVLPKMEFVPDAPSANMAWTETQDDIPEPTQFLIQSEDTGVEWCLLNSFGRSKDYMKGFESSDPFKSAQMGIELVLVKQADLDKLRNLTSAQARNNDHDIFDNSWASPQLFGMRSFRSKLPGSQLQLDRTIGGIEFGRLTDSYSPKYSEYDCSGVKDESDFVTPIPTLLGELKLRPKDAWSNYFVDEHGHPAFSEVPGFLSGAAIVRRDLIESFARKHSLVPVWRVWVEKDGGLGTHHHAADHRQFARHDFIGYYFPVGGKWNGSLIPFRTDN